MEPYRSDKLGKDLAMYDQKAIEFVNKLKSRLSRKMILSWFSLIH